MTAKGKSGIKPSADSGPLAPRFSEKCNVRPSNGRQSGHRFDHDGGRSRRPLGANSRARCWPRGDWSTWRQPLEQEFRGLPGCPATRGETDPPQRRWHTPPRPAVGSSHPNARCDVTTSLDASRPLVGCMQALPSKASTLLSVGWLLMVPRSARRVSLGDFCPRLAFAFARALQEICSDSVFGRLYVWCMFLCFPTRLSCCCDAC